MAAAASMVLALALAGASDAVAAPIVFRPKVEVTASVVELRDIADLSGLPPSLRLQVTHLALLRFGDHQDQVLFSASQAAARVRALAPAMRPWLSGVADVQVEVRRRRSLQAASGNTAPALRCMLAQGPIAAGGFPSADDFRAAACSDKTASATRYDAAAGVVRASRDIAAGEIVAAVPDFAMAGVKPGERIYVEARVGVVKVERAFEAVAPSRQGQAFFAKASDGAIASVPYPETAR